MGRGGPAGPITRIRGFRLAVVAARSPVARDFRAISAVALPCELRTPCGVAKLLSRAVTAQKRVPRDSRAAAPARASCRSGERASFDRPAASRGHRYLDLPSFWQPVGESCTQFARFGHMDRFA